MASEDRYKLFDMLARHPGDGANGAATSPLNGQTSREDPSTTQ